MSQTIKIPANERDTIHVFRLDMLDDEVKTFTARREGTDDPASEWPLRNALGADYIEPQRIEVIRTGDLSGVGLRGYLIEGLGAKPERVKADGDRLDAVEGHVLIALPGAFGGVEQTLDPRKPLDYVGSYPEIAPEAPGPMGDVHSAHPPDATVSEAPASETPRGPEQPSRFPVVGAALIAAAVIVLIIWLFA
ncbi:hypothetical protein [Tranquillimonas alkanivorans]|uniref:Uncharacterized protein n=1 Tax=Tranquillimonas alkanivorans TaxID=441119 RepID=A0A1I5KY26_9RHOB|nr:hypothetical protein [Tranquillimonas alkanivorans]SFO89798.1 hypothetical protein SAMN04488047_101357 [Tranquillimonas alkanivorans]